MGDEVEDRSMVSRDDVNGQWELQGLIRCVGGHGTFGAHVVRGVYKHRPHFLKIAYHYKVIINLQN
jgi:hypothetical protein